MPFTLALGQKAPDFNLPATDGKDYSLASFAAAPVLVICFTCNHCPYVIGNESREKAFAEKFQPRGVVYLAINSNDVNAYASDDFPHMVERSKKLHFIWPYLHDESQAVATAYGAIKTPQFFVFDRDRVLRYVGRMDNSPRDAALAKTHELSDAVEDLLAGRPIAMPAADAIGCTVKWRGKDKHFIPIEACDLQ
jgi:peroxiredoxin